MLGDAKEFGSAHHQANKEDWNKILLATKVCSCWVANLHYGMRVIFSFETGTMPNLEDVLNFISTYTSSSLSMAL